MVMTGLLALPLHASRRQIAAGLAGTARLFERVGPPAPGGNARARRRAVSAGRSAR
jgi:hypothetical protein